MSRLFLAVLVSPALLFSQPTSLSVVGVTNTQALIHYISPDPAPCTLSDSLSSNDLNGRMFKSAQYDLSRPGTVTHGNERFVVVGARYRAEMDSTGIYRSRALPTETSDTLKVTCGTASATVAFKTLNIPLGNTFSETIPGDPAHPGNIAWPEFTGLNRNQVVVDPQTGLPLVRVSLPQDQPHNTSGARCTAAAPVGAGGGTWSGSGSPIASFTGVGAGTSDWLFIRAPLSFYNGASYVYDSASPDYFVLHLSAWCSDSPQCASDSTLQFALTADAKTPIGTPIDKPVAYCASDCLKSKSLIAGDTRPILAAWGVNEANPLDHVMASRPTFGILVRKKTNSRHTVNLQNATFDWGSTPDQTLGSSAMQDADINCSSARVEDTPGDGNWGFVCEGSQGTYWISTTKFPDIRYIGAWVVPYGRNPATNCSGNGFDISNPRIQRCPVPGYNNQMLVYEVRYYGNFVDVGSDAKPVAVCNKNRSNMPCLTVVDLTAGTDIETLARAFNPSITKIKTAKAPMFISNLGSNNNLAFFKWSQQSTMGWYAIFDPIRKTVVATRDTYSLWPARFAATHSIQDRRNPNLGLPIDYALAGAPSGHADAPGMGPYRVSVPAGIPAPLQTCPSQPTGSPVTDWPTGQKCLRISVDGEPCDPSPAWYTTASTDGVGKVTLSAGNPKATFTGGRIYGVGLVGATMVINGTTYTFTGAIDNSTMTVKPTPTVNIAGADVTIIWEPAGGSKCGNPKDFYLQDAAPRDIFFATTGEYRLAYRAPVVETFRLLCRGNTCDSNTSTTWWVEAQYKNTSVKHTVWKPGVYLYASIPVDLPDQELDIAWNWQVDPYGKKEAGNVIDPDPAYGHGFYSLGMAAYFTNPATYPCPGAKTSLNWAGSALYNNCFQSRQALDYGNYIGQPVHFQPMVPPFAGWIGCCWTNTVDDHPGFYQIAAQPRERKWYLGSTVFNGQAGLSGSPTAPITPAGQRYVYPANKVNRGCETPSVCLSILHAVDQIRSFGSVPLVDVSGPKSAISTGPADSYKMCTALVAGECAPGTHSGDLVVNVPGATKPFCEEPPIGQNSADVKDICVTFNSAYLQSIVQRGTTATGMKGELSRSLGHVLGHYRWYSAFWNSRATADGKFGLTQVRMLGNLRSELVGFLIPPYPDQDKIDRSDFLPVKVPVTVPAGQGINNVIAEFGYLEYGGQFYCSPNRLENCRKGNQPGNGWGWATENPPALPCPGSCTVTIPALSSRVLYYRILYLAGTALKQTGPVNVVTTP